MTVLRNNFDGGPDNADITSANSGFGENDAFDAYNNPVSADTILKYKSAEGLDRPTAEYVARIGSGVSSGTMYVAWTSSMGAQSQFWMREYVRFDVLPDNFTSPGIFTSLKISPLTIGGSLGILSSGGASPGCLFTEDTGGTVYAAMSTPVVEDTWWRVEARFEQSPTTGNGEVRYYADADADIDDYTESLTFSNWNLGTATVDMYLYGYYPADSGLEDMYVSGVALSSEGWIGPAPFRAGKGVPGILSNPLAIHSSTW